jgi:hypothetical protein
MNEAIANFHLAIAHYVHNNQKLTKFEIEHSRSEI